MLGSALYQRTVWLWVLIALSYFPITELYTGKTLGKKKAGLIVVDEAGHLPNLSQVLKRTAARLLEVNPITGGGLIAAIAVLATEDHQRLGDLWAETSGSDDSSRHCDPCVRRAVEGSRDCDRSTVV